MSENLKNDWNRITITNVNPNIKEQLSNIARNAYDMQLGPFLRMELRKIMNNYPESFRTKKTD